MTTLLVIFTLGIVLGFAHVIHTEIRWNRRLAEMAREVRERENG